MDEATRRVCDFLWFGFCPDVGAAAARCGELASLAEDVSVPTFSVASVRSARDLLVEIVGEQLGGAAEVVMGLSAGYDSRAILGALLEILPAEAITVYTFGHEGAKDYDLAGELAGWRAGRHLRLDMLAAGVDRWDTGRLVEQVRARSPGVFLGVGEFGLEQEDELPGGAVEFNGYLGGSLAGRKLPTPVSGRWADAVDVFVRRNRAFKGAVDLVPAGYDPRGSLPAQAPHGTAQLMLDDQIDWCFRQEQRLRSYALAHGGARRPVRLPYADPRWWRSWMLMPTRHRTGYGFFKKVLGRGFKKVFPDIIDGVEQRPPLPRGVPKPMHIDMDRMFVGSPPFRRFIEENVADLGGRGVVPWLDVEGILRRARRDPARLGRPLYGLASLEVNLKAGRGGIGKS